MFSFELIDRLMIPFWVFTLPLSTICYAFFFLLVCIVYEVVTLVGPSGFPQLFLTKWFPPLCLSAYFIFLLFILLSCSVIEFLLILFMNQIILQAVTYFPQASRFCQPEWFFFFLVIQATSFNLLHSKDLFEFFLWLELQSLSTYILIAVFRTSTLAVEAAIKYFVIGSIASGLLLYSIADWYHVYGSLNFTDIENLILFKTIKSVTHVQHSYLVFLLLGLSIKLGVAPFHLWVADVYEGSSTVLTLTLTTVIKYVLYIQLLGFGFYTFHVFTDQVSFIWFSLTAASLLLGSLAAYAQKKTKRFIAFSSVVNIGFLLTVVFFPSVESLYSSLIYWFFYFLALVLIFTLINNITYYRQFLVNFRLMRLLAPLSLFTLSIAFASFVGLPPFTGFFIKLYIFYNFFYYDFSLFFIFIIGATIIACFYYFRPIVFTALETFSLSTFQILLKKLLKTVKTDPLILCWFQYFNNLITVGYCFQVKSLNICFKLFALTVATHLYHL